jgi:hypothetical protein
MSNAAPSTPRRSRVTLWLILAISVAPVAASYLLYYFWPPAHTVNYGELIEARALPDAVLTLSDGAPFRLSQLKGKWVLVSVDGGRCDAECEKKLVYMRQLRLTQGKDMDRVERAWLVSDTAAPRADAVSGFPGTWVAKAAGRGLIESFPAPRTPADHIYVIDPLGNLMMRFPRDPDTRRLIKDLSRLLKASRVG